jgi:hypothetical protein
VTLPKLKFMASAQPLCHRNMQIFARTYVAFSLMVTTTQPLELHMYR